MAAKEAEVRVAKAQLEAVRREKAEVRGDEARVVVLLEEAGKRFEALRGGVKGVSTAKDGPVVRGLESLASQVATPNETTDDDVDYPDLPGEDDGFGEMRTMGLGTGMGSRIGMAGMAGMAGRPGDGYDSDEY